MASEKETIQMASDKYTQFLHEDHAAAGTIEWRHGGPPSYVAVNDLFEQGRTKFRELMSFSLAEADLQLPNSCHPVFSTHHGADKFSLSTVWPERSLEETVQNAIKSWEMELSHKTRAKDFRTINPEKFKLFVNGREGLSAEETLKLGSYNALLKSSVPNEFKYYKADEETFESSHDAFRSAFPRGFAWEVINVYTGPPVVTYKFRHWGFFEGPFKGHAPTGEKVQFHGVGIMKVDETLRAEDVEIYYDPAELFAGLLKGPPISESNIEQQGHDDNTTTQYCPYIHN